MNRGFNFRVYPTEKQREYFNECFRISNFIYNYSLRQQIDISESLDDMGIKDKEERNKYMTVNKLYFNKYKMSNLLTQMSKTEEYSFLNINSLLRGYSLRQIDNAFKNMRKTGAGFPKFKNRLSKKTYSSQIQKRTKFHLNLNNEKFGYLSTHKIDKLKISCHDEYFRKNYKDNTKIKLNSFTITNKGNQYHISIQVDVIDPNFNLKHKESEINENSSIGIDLGVKRPITTSNINDFDEKIFSTQIQLLKTYSEELKKLSSILNKKRDYHKKNKTDIKYWESVNYIRIKNKISSLHIKIGNIRSNIQHNITKKLINLDNVDSYILEELKTKNMMKRSGKGLSNNKSGLNRVLSDVGLYGIREKLTYKAERIGKNVITVPPQYTSQKCSNCGHINKKNRKSQSKFNCVKCGFKINADLNAAINIKDKYFKKNVV